MSVIDPDIELAVAEAIQRNPHRWDTSLDDDLDPRVYTNAPPRHPRHAAADDVVTSNPADDQATRLRALLQQQVDRTSDMSVPLVSVPTLSKADTKTSAKLPTMIAIASGKGGVGKTNIAVNLAVSLAAGDARRVTLLDADLGTANADVICGVTPPGRLEHVIQTLPTHDGGRRALRDIAVDVPGGNGARLIAGSSGVGRLADLSSTQQRQLLSSLAQLEDDTDVLIVDTGAGVSRAVTSFVRAADLTLVVTTPEPTAITDAYALIKCASADEIESTDANAARSRFMLVVNQVSGEDEARRVHARLAAVCDRFLGVPLPMLGWVAHDLRLAEAVRARQPLVVRSPKSAAARDIQVIGTALAQQIGLAGGALSENKGVSGGRAGISGVLARVLRFSGR